MSLEALLTNSEKGLSKKKLEQLYEQAGNAKAGSPPTALVVDHTNAENPYLSLYGEKEWEEKVSKCAHMKKYKCITTLVTHIHDYSAQVMKGTKHEKDWLFYHDALSLMTAKATIAWMKEKEIYHRWLLLMGINKGTCFFGRTIGNSPEMMPLDSTLNADVDGSVRYHISLTTHLPEDDIRKFSMSTPKRGSRAYHRIWEEVPCSRRIIEDTDWFLTAIQVISDHDGKAVAGLGSRKGHRNEETRSLKKKGGIRIKKAKKEKRFVHKDAFDCREMCIHSSILLHADTPKEEPEPLLTKAEGAAVVENKIMAAECTLTECSKIQILSSRPCDEWGKEEAYI